MINIIKVIEDIKYDGKYDAVLEKIKKTLENENPTKEEISDLISKDPFYIKEYKDLNRWGELSSVHLNELIVKDADSIDTVKLKEQINKNAAYLKNFEEYEIKQKNLIYGAWTFFIALPFIYVIDNIVRITGLYSGNEESVYISFFIVIVASIWGYIKVVTNHKRQHEQYIQTQIDTKALILNGLKNNSFTYVEVYLH